MAAWQTRAIIFPLFTLHMAGMFSLASFEVVIKCWWHRISSNVYIECQTDPQGSILECDLSHLHMHPVNPEVHISSTALWDTSVRFSAVMDADDVQKTDCSLLCPGHTPLPCSIQEGYPPPICLIPIYDEERNIHCHWKGSLNPSVPTNFTLHWSQNVQHEDSDLDVGERDSGIIPRNKYTSHELIRVWISATNASGKIDSESLVTNTFNIDQPVSPVIKLQSREPLEISWSVDAQEEYSGQWKCKVQYKTQCDQKWTQVEGTYEVSFIFEDALPFTTYKFRVRCSASEDKPVMSNWSAEFMAETPGAAPVGVLDLWSDCDLDAFNCTILWKEMPKQQARGNVENYVVTMTLNNGSELNINRSVYTSVEKCVQCELDRRKEPSDLISHAQHLKCPQQQNCLHYYALRIPFNKMKGIGVTANTAFGKSNPAIVALPRTGLLQGIKMFELRGRSQELNVSWSRLSFSDSVQEYVVQLKPVGRPHNLCLNWFKVDKKQTFTVIRGQLLNFTAYNVSLFAIINNHSCLLKSEIAYTVEGVPPAVRDFQATAITSLSVTLTWTPIPLNESQGRILQYLVGIANDVAVYNVNSNQRSLQLSNLNPEQHYEVWINAKTSAGEGKRTTARFTTTSSGGIIRLVGIIVPVFFLIPLVLVVRWCLKTKLMETFYKIPDPINSSSFKQMSNQFLSSWPVSSTSMEHGQIISAIEVILQPKVALEPEVDQSKEHGEHERNRGKAMQRYEGVERENVKVDLQKEYSQMIDSSEEGDRENEDEYDEWNEEPFPSDYEQHFLPCTVNV